MTALVPLHFDTSDVRMIVKDGEPWWVLNDVCAVLQIANPRDASTRLRDWQKGVGNADTLGGRQDLILVNEAGLYKLALTSRKPVAEKFERWLTTEVLPSIRKFGMYPPPPETALLPEANENPWAGRDKTLAERFKEERLRWEAETGYPLAGTVPHISKQIVIAIENELGGIRKGRRMEFLLYAGIDVLYVMTGARTMTTSERALRDAFRGADPVQRFRLLASAEIS